MHRPFLYCGDTHLQNAAAYLAGLLASAAETFRYVPSDQSLVPADLHDEIRLIILSDYPAARFPQDLQRRAAALVSAGAGLLMIGGWESFHGLGGDWDVSPLAELLPVKISPHDDRLNSDRPLLVRPTGPHPITEGLPWDARPPYVGGLNRLAARPGGEVLLEVDRLHCGRDENRWTFQITETMPLLVVGSHGAGRTAALATDVAPHWVGGMVDWGSGRVSAHAPNADAVEVGDLYAQFFLQLVRWTKGA